MGTRSANLKVGLTLSGAAQNKLLDNGSACFNLSEVINKELKNGVAAGEIDRLWRDEARALPVGSEVIDVYDFAAQDIGAGLGNDPLGQPMALEEIALILITNKSETGTLLVGGEGSAAAFSSPFSGDDNAILAVPPLSTVMLCSENKPGYDVEDVNNHLLKFEAVVADVTYDLIIAGRSA